MNADWNIEAALDIEWAHAMAPNAKIYLVEAASNSYADLLNAVSVANSLLKSAGGGEVSMSWGGSEFPPKRTTIAILHNQELSTSHPPVTVPG